METYRVERMLAELHERLRAGDYRPPASPRVLILKLRRATPMSAHSVLPRVLPGQFAEALHSKADSYQGAANKIAIDAVARVKE